MKSTVEILRGSREMLTGAWWGGGSGATEGQVCAEQAIRRAAEIATGWTPAHDALLRVIGVHDPLAPPSAIYSWNDDPERTHADVLAAFDRAIAVEEARAQEFTVAAEPVVVPA